MSNQFALVPFLDQDRKPKIEQLAEATAQYEALCKGVETVLQQMVRASDTLQKLVLNIGVLANDYEQMLMTRVTGGLSVDITESQYSLTTLVNERTTAPTKVEQATIARYTRKLISRYHPDRKGGDAAVLDNVLKASRAGVLEILYLYLVASDPRQLDIEEYDKMLAKLANRKARLQASKAFHVVRMWMSGRKREAEVLCVKAIDMRRLSYLNLLSGSAFTGDSDADDDTDFDNDPDPCVH